MIHQVHLPALTRKRLTDVVMLQLRLLYYAASTATVDEASCAQYLDQHARFRGRGTQIARWLWRTPKRHKQLEAFARGPAAERRAWCRRLARETLVLIRNPAGSITHHVNKNASSWQNAGATFLRNFYHDLCASSGLPGYLFSGSDAPPFRRQDFLSEFQDRNQALYVCAVCDETRYHTVVDDSILTDIEHYLPKSRYPHLACHPFNLLPVCHHCNLLKKNADPLKGNSNNPRNLEDIFLPYREPGLGSLTYLQVRLGTTYTSTRLGQLKPRTTTDLRQKLAAFGEVYKVPKRWRGQVNTIGETLFRRLQRFSHSGWRIPSGNTMPQTLLAMLDQLLYYLYEDQGKEPFAFAMTWWLAALINHEVEPATHNPSHPTPQVAALLQAVSIEPSTSTQPRSGTPILSQPLAIARSLRGSIR
jgi:5-methylcytosine-specific restriction endonuclease McrA